MPDRGALTRAHPHPLEGSDRRLAPVPFSNGPTEAANNLIKRVKRVAFGLTRFRNHRIRVLLYAGRPNWDLLATIRPCWGEMPLSCARTGCAPVLG